MMVSAMADQESIAPEVEAGSSQVSMIADGVIEIQHP